MNLRHLLAPAALAAVLLAGCGYEPTQVPEPEAAEAAASAPPVAVQDCGDPTRSYAPGDTLAALSTTRDVNRIEQAGRLRVGVSADSYLLGSRDSITGTMEGFDIDMVRAVARALFPDVAADDIDSRITYRVITAADRIPALERDTVDLVVRNFSITCDRWQQIAFAAAYYVSGQQVLVLSDLAEEGVDSVDELGGHSVCAPAGTTSLTNIEAAAPDDAEIVTAANHTDCLLRFQAGEVDAITGDDTVLAGLSAQDPYAVVPREQEAFSVEPYGIGVNAARPDLVRFVNAVLEQARADGTWQASYDRWLRPELGAGTQPEPTYGREG